MIYRAICYKVTDHPGYGFTADTDEVIVLFEAPPTECRAQLRTMLKGLWGCMPEQVEWYNLASEDELFRDSMDETGETGDLRLLETGWSDGKIRYARNPLILVGKKDRPRLYAALASLHAAASEMVAA